VLATERPTDEEEWEDLLSAVDARGGALEETKSVKTDGKVHEEHLRDLGYLE